MIWKDLQSFTQGALTQIKSNAMAPILWLTGVVGVLGLFAAVTFVSQGAMALAWASFAVVAITIGSALIAQMRFVFTDPDRLQTEQYLLTNRFLEVSGSKNEGLQFNDESEANVIDVDALPQGKILRKSNKAVAESLGSEGDDGND